MRGLALWKSAGATVLAIVVGLVSIASWTIYLQKKLEPPAGVTELRQFLALMPAPRRLVRVNRNGRGYFVWIGETAPLPAVVSGPSCYVFDSTGRLVEWSTETGEGGKIEEYASQAWTSQEITLQQAMKATETPQPDSAQTQRPLTTDH